MRCSWHALTNAVFTLLMMVLLLWPGAATAREQLEALLADPEAGAEAKGVAVAEAARRVDAGFGDERVAVRMVLHDARGSSSERSIRIATLEGVEEGDRSLILFDAPRDQRGTALLTWNHAERESDQWLYLPSLRRVKKIAARNRSGPFVGSEFAFEDLTAEEVSNYRWRFVGEVACDERRCLEVERFPVESWSGYSRQQVFYDLATLRIERIEYYDRRGDHLKTLLAGDWTRHQDRHWRAGHMDMRNHQTGRRTELIWSDHSFGHGLSPDDFSTAALQRLN
ncbi:MAG: outer membrane lipoprotein-sorting protein [Gammaproteobacteria bacterium]|nr:outer membrane lipoprotein-sorting protein [Gammaproteobacteria bacterium]